MWSQQGVCLSPRAEANAATAAPSCLTETPLQINRTSQPASQGETTTRPSGEKDRRVVWDGGEEKKKKKSETETREEGWSEGRWWGGVRDVGDGRRKGNLCFALNADAGRSLINVRVYQPPSCLSTAECCYRFPTGPECNNNNTVLTVRSELCLLANHYLKAENISLLNLLLFLRTSPKFSLLVLVFLYKKKKKSLCSAHYAGKHIRYSTSFIECTISAIRHLLSYIQAHRERSTDDGLNLGFSNIL